MAGVDQAAGSRLPQRRRGSRTWTCGLLAGVPLLAFAVGAIAVHASVPASDIVVGFRPTLGMWGIGLACAVLHATWFGRQLRASGRDVADGTSICVDQALWERVAVGNQLALIKVRSEFGRQIQWEPETPAFGLGGRHG